ncbi:hypothetical protein A2635_04755 [Candidatus Peribacteria bacterium RIFCSPHIGHO2_01_FULL_51_9]|nr:MAG: hypothetical protein A2635_04755 [Candidatus Peribacteria bacterium RIFCSPHIGHO2_01_FULL_51_9]
MKEITYQSPDFYSEIVDHSDPHVHLVLLATKPDIIKQVPLYKELKKRGYSVVLGHTGQHYDENLSGGMLREFGVEPDFNLNVRGSLHEVVSQIIERLGYLIGELKARGRIVIPYVHGDTTTAMAASNAGYCHRFASVHVEAGIRTLTPRYTKSPLCHPELVPSTKLRTGFGRHSGVMVRRAHHDTIDMDSWREFLMQRENWERGSLEPYPEQFNTRCSECATGIHLAPVELDREFLISEGFPDDRIFVVGNSVADALEEAVGRKEESTVFERYPTLQDGNFVRFCIHRRENCLSQKRFLAIYDAMKMFIEEGRRVLLINMNQTKMALEQYGLTGEVEKLASTHENFILSDVWSEYGDVIAVMSKAAVCATDSGSMQEEMNVLGVPCVTLRYGSDRSESAMVGGNLIAPPVEAKLLKKIIEYAWDNPKMRSVPKIYGKNVSKQSIDAIERVLKGGEVFRSENERIAL